jgi:predicted peptidase
MKKATLFYILTFFCSVASAQEINTYSKHWFVMNGDTMPYRILLPENYQPAQKYPLVLFLHGRGESGTDNEKQLANGATLFLETENRLKHKAIVIFPQCAPGSYWSNTQTVYHDSLKNKRHFYFIEDGPPSTAMVMAMHLVQNIFERYPVNKQQVYVMGLSMGGMGTFEIVRRMPNVFAAAVPICGGAHPSTAPKLVKTKWWIFHGLKDDLVDPGFSKKMEAALKKSNASVRATYYPDANHNSWDPAFREPGLLDWLFSQKLSVK